MNQCLIVGTIVGLCTLNIVGCSSRGPKGNPGQNGTGEVLPAFSLTGMYNLDVSPISVITVTNTGNIPITCWGWGLQIPNFGFDSCMLYPLGVPAGTAMQFTAEFIHCGRGLTTDASMYIDISCSNSAGQVVTQALTIITAT